MVTNADWVERVVGDFEISKHKLGQISISDDMHSIFGLIFHDFAAKQLIFRNNSDQALTLFQILHKFLVA